MDHCEQKLFHSSPENPANPKHSLSKSRHLKGFRWDWALRPDERLLRPISSDSRSLGEFKVRGWRKSSSPDEEGSEINSSD